jgi:alkyl sulfatase BDS1-like metallo-beta-lactamase superfamily hydrolase
MISAGQIKLEGEPKALGVVFANVETFDPNFKIVTP